VPGAKFILDPCVEDELWEIWKFIAVDNPEAATRVVEAAYKTFATLALTPGFGRPRKSRDPCLKGIRSWSISGFDSYLIFYRGAAEGVQVMHAYHASRNIDALFERTTAGR